VIEEVDQQLSSWAQQLLPGATISLVAPAGPTADIGLQLVELSELPAARGDSPPPLQLRLGYLVTAAGSDPAQAHGRLGQLLIAALVEPAWEVRFPTDLVEFWRAFGVTPQPAFLISVIVRQPREFATAPLVSGPLTIKVVQARELTGRLLGPGDQPIADAFVEIPELALSTRSDAQGWFAFPVVPSDPTKEDLRVTTREREFAFTVDSSTDDPVKLHLDLEKE
jgi:hypothetical protein